MSGPFGEQDAAAMSDTEVLENFVGFDSATDRSLEAMSVTDTDARTLVYVGARGSGRTMFLRRATASARVGEQAYVLPTDNHNPPDSSTIAFLCDALPGPADSVKGWQNLWRAAILRSISSHLLYDVQLGRPLELTDEGLMFEPDFEEVLQLRSRPGGFCPEPSGVYSQVTSIAETYRYRGADALAGYLRYDLWDKLERRLSTILSGFRPLALYIDSLDREFRHAPYAWLACEKGLFYQVIRLSENQLLRDRLRVVTTVRDLTYSLARHGDGTSRWGPQGRIRSLEWEPAAARQLLREKILNNPNPDHVMRRPTGEEDAVAAWLGRTIVPNVRTGAQEPVETYLLSHTFASPRDIVAMGNALGQLVRRASTTGAPAVDPHDVRDVVERLAYDFATERLATVAAEIAALPHNTELREAYAEMRSSRGGPGDAGYLPDAKLPRMLERIIRAVRRVDFRRDDLAEAIAIVAPDIPPEDTLAALWRSGLVGYRADTAHGPDRVYYRAGRWDRLEVPHNRDDLCFHRCLIDVAELAPPDVPY